MFNRYINLDNPMNRPYNDFCWELLENFLDIHGMGGRDMYWFLTGRGM